LSRGGGTTVRRFPAFLVSIFVLLVLASAPPAFAASGTTVLNASSFSATSDAQRIAPAAIPAASAMASSTLLTATTAASSTALSVSPAASAVASSTLLAVPANSDSPKPTTLSAPAAVSSTVPTPAPTGRDLSPPTAKTGAAPGGTVPGGKTPAGKPASAKPKDEGPSAAYYENLHKRAMIVNLPSAYAAHVGKDTGENAEVFLAWYIGSLYRYDQVGDYDRVRGLFIQQIMSLYIGADVKWAFIRESGWFPAMAMGYYGGFGLPSFAGGTVKASTVAKDAKADKNKVKREETKSAFMHNGYAVMSERFGWLTASAGVLYGFKKGFPQFIPMLRNASFTTVSNPASQEMLTLFGGLDLAWKYRHFKLEVVTVPMEPSVTRPWLIQTHIDEFLGFDFALVKDAVGYQVVGYYVLPFFRWPDQKRLTKEYERTKTRRK